MICAIVYEMSRKVQEMEMKILEDTCYFPN